MSKEMNEVLKIVQDKQINSEIQSRKIEKERIEKENRKIAESEERSRMNKEILDNSGIAELFNEIIDKGLLKYKNSPVEKRIPVYKNKLFKGEVIDRWEWKIKSEYTPAFISYGNENNSISLCFNYWERGFGDSFDYGAETIKAVVTSDKTVSLKLDYYDEKYERIEKEIPLNKKNLGQVIGTEVAKHIK